MTQPLILVLAAGPGLGLSVARRFGREGYAAALAGQTAERMQPLVDTLVGEGITATGLGVDLANEAAVRSAVAAVGEAADRIDVLHFNPSVFRQTDPLELTVDELFADLSIGLAPLLPAVQAALPYMSPGARVLITGSAAADKPWHEAATLGVQKAGVRNLATSLEVALSERGVHVACVQVNGSLGEPGFAHEQVADALYAAVDRPDEGWTVHVPYNG